MRRPYASFLSAPPLFCNFRGNGDMDNLFHIVEIVLLCHPYIYKNWSLNQKDQLAKTFSHATYFLAAAAARMSMHRPYWMSMDPNGYGAATAHGSSWPTPPPSTRLASSASPPSSYTSSSTSASGGGQPTAVSQAPASTTNGSGPVQLPPTPPKDPHLQHDQGHHKPQDYHDPYHPAGGPPGGGSSSYQPDHLEESKDTVQLLTASKPANDLSLDPEGQPHPSSSPSATPSNLLSYEQDYSGNPGSNSNPETSNGRGFKSEITGDHPSVTPDNNSSYSNYSSLSHHPSMMSPGEAGGASASTDPYSNSAYGSAYMPNSASTSSNARLSTNSSTTSNSTSAKSSKGKNRPNAGENVKL